MIKWYISEKMQLYSMQEKSAYSLFEKSKSLNKIKLNCYFYFINLYEEKLIN